MTRQRIESYLSGRWQSGAGDGATLFNPATEEPLATASSQGLDLAHALQHARSVGGSELRRMTFSQRAALLERMAGVLQSGREPLIDSAIANGGCTRSDAKFDVDGAILVLSHYAVGKALGDRRILADGEGIQLGRSPRFWGQHVLVPRAGVAVLINAFNFPAWGFAEKAACALLAGMPVLSKPATSTALTAYLATQALVAAADLPPGVLSFLGGGANDLLDHLGPQDALCFTGSASTGRKLRGHARVIEHSVPVNVEADSLNAAVLGPDADMGGEVMALFLKEVLREMTQKTGQKCTATRRVLVPADKVKDVAAEIGARLAEITIGDPALKDVRMGPLATKDQLADVRAGVALLAKDASVVCGDPAAKLAPVGVPNGKGWFFAPLVFQAHDSKNASHVHSHEVFGPVTTLLPYGGGADEAAQLVNRGGGGLVASVYSDDRGFTESVTLGIAPWHGRVYLGSSKVLEHAMGSGLALPQCVHGGPGRAGGGQEMGGLLGLQHFMQRTAIQGSRPTVEQLSGTKPDKA